MDKSLIYIGLALIIAVYYFTVYNSSNSSVVNNTDSVDMTNNNQTFPGEGSLQQNLSNKWLQLATSICVNFSLEIDPKAILATIEQESGSRSLTENCDTVIGDQGRSIGFCQVEQGALTDLNGYFGTDYVFTDLNDNTNNITCGLLYLALCLNINQSQTNPYWLAYKRYNGGRGQTDTSINSMATTYANSAYNKYQVYLQG
jgi:soluble lytic murein transglycosylase-like protein